MIEPPLFVAGAQRSGTTIFARTLARKIGSGLVVNGKVAYYLVVWLLANAPEWDGRHARLDEVAHALRRVPPQNVTPQALDASITWLLEAGPAICRESANAKDAVSRIWHGCHLRLAPAATVAGEKYNELLLHLHQLLLVFPDARVAFVYRDPADVAESMVRHFAGRPWAPVTLADAARKYVAWNDAWESVRPTIPAANRFEICYEDFVERPAAVLDECCRALRLPCDAVIPLDDVDGSHRGRGRVAARAAAGALSAAAEWYASARRRGPGSSACAR